MIHAHASHTVKIKIGKETVKLGVGLLRWSRVPAGERLGYKMMKGENGPNLVYMLHKNMESSNYFILLFSRQSFTMHIVLAVQELTTQIRLVSNSQSSFCLSLLRACVKGLYKRLSSNISKKRKKWKRYPRMLGAQQIMRPCGGNPHKPVLAANIITLDKRRFFECLSY